VSTCTQPIGAFVNNRAATFTMALCAPDRQFALDTARESFEWYPKAGARHIASMTDWMIERKQDLGSYSYAADMKKIDDEGALDLLSLEYLVDANACVVGTPEDCIRTCRLYEEAGIDLLLCLVNPYKIPHDVVMQTIELMGTEVIPAFRR
jgi:alkanesulfonate monooxygenase SsuD/methylene tetrahydromethanopterin reductase-like flavin-dependent oxidoreductase (luciferase family)